jgi:hypothetical protein
MAGPFGCGPAARRPCSIVCSGVLVDSDYYIESIPIAGCSQRKRGLSMTGLAILLTSPALHHIEIKHPPLHPLPSREQENRLPFPLRQRAGVRGPVNLNVQDYKVQQQTEALYRIHNKENAVATIKKILFACLCLSLVFPAIVCAGEDNPAAEQKRVAEKFITALKAGDYKTAHACFIPDVRGRYPLPVFVDVQENVNKTLGSLTSYAFKSVKKPDAAQEKVSVQPSNTYVYELVYKKDARKTKIPVELTFGSGDSAGQLLACKYLKDQMSPGEKKK